MGVVVPLVSFCSKAEIRSKLCLHKANQGIGGIGGHRRAATEDGGRDAVTGKLVPS